MDSLKVSKEEIKQEVLERMKILNLEEKVIRRFKEENTLCKSMEIHTSKEIVIRTRYIRDNEKEIINQFENETNLFVYHIIKSFNNVETIFDLLYISQNKEEWEKEKEELKNGSTKSNTIKVIDNKIISSEIKTIGIKSILGGVVKTSLIHKK